VSAGIRERELGVREWTGSLRGSAQVRDRDDPISPRADSRRRAGSPARRSLESRVCGASSILSIPQHPPAPLMDRPWLGTVVLAVSGPLPMTWPSS
jgi:hypothetical protein